MRKGGKLLEVGTELTKADRLPSLIFDDDMGAKGSEFILMSSGPSLELDIGNIVRGKI